MKVDVVEQARQRLAAVLPLALVLGLGGACTGADAGDEPGPLAGHAPAAACTGSACAGPTGAGMGGAGYPNAVGVQGPSGDPADPTDANNGNGPTPDQAMSGGDGDSTTGDGDSTTGDGDSTTGDGDSSDPGACDPGSPDTAWASECPTSQPCSTSSGSFQAPAVGSDGHPLRAESEHFAIYWHSGDPDGGGPLRGLSNPPSQATLDGAFETLETLWDSYFGAPIFFPEPYCGASTRWKATVHLDDYYPLWGGGWGGDKMGLWIGVGALMDNWGLAHEFMHGVQSTTQAFPDCGGDGCWVFESHANWMPHQVYRDDVHCSELLVNAPHLYYGNTRDRYCNWQFFEFIKDKYCYRAIHDMWAFDAPRGQRDPFEKLMLSQGWDIERLNDEFGEWAMHNVTWDYRDPPPTDGRDQGARYRAAYGSMTDPGDRPERTNRLTRLVPLDDDFASHRRFASPYYGAPQRWGYNLVRLHPEAGAGSVRVTFRGIEQDGAHSGFRFGLVASDPDLTTARYSALHAGTDGAVELCIEPGEAVFLVVTATPTEYVKIPWTNPGDGPAYPSLYRYPYMVELQGAWPDGFLGGTQGACPSGTARHPNGGGCATPDTPASVYVGPYARVLGGSVSGSARIEDQATVLRGTISGGTVGALSVIGTARRGVTIEGSPTVRTTFLPLGWFGGTQVSGDATVVGDAEFNVSVASGFHYGLVDGNGRTPVAEVTTPPPYAWRP